MADIKIVKLKIRRGTDAQRRSVVLDQGELGYTTDTKRLYVGNGVLSGGLSVGPKNNNPLTNYASLSNTNAETGDIIIANNLFYQLTGSNYANITHWANISQRFEPTYFGFLADNSVIINADSLDADRLNPNNVNGGLWINGGNLQVKPSTQTLIISSNDYLTVKNEGIGVHQLASAAFGNGLSGGAGQKVGIKFDSSTLYLKFGDTLSVSAFPAGSVTFSSLDTAWFGQGLIVDTPNQKIKTVLTDVDNSTIIKDLSGKISLQTGLASATNEWALVATDTYGRTIFNRSSIYDTVSCLSSTDTGPLSSLFNGTPNQSLSGGLAGIPITTFTVLSSNATGTVGLTLSSAGFILFQGNSTARQDGKYVGRFAIPVFTY